RIARCPETATVVLDNRTHDREAHTHSLRFGREESIEQPWHGFRLYAFPGVADRDADAPSLELTCAYLDLTGSVGTLADGIECILDEVHQYLDKLCPIANNGRKVDWQVKLQSDVFG